MGNLDKLGEYYQTYKDDWDNVHRSLFAWLEKLSIEHLKPGSCLEMGLGDLYFTDFLVSRPEFTFVISVDGATSIVDAANEKFKDFRHYSALHSYFEDFEPLCKFDTIFATHIYEHVDDPVQIMKRMRTWLADDGVAIINVPHANSIHRFVGVELGMISHPSELNDRDKALGHQRVYTLNRLCKDCRDAGLTVVDSGGFFLKPLSQSQMNGWDSSLLDAFMELGSKYPEIAAEAYVICRK